MKRYRLIMWAILGVLTAASAAGAGDFDGSKPLLVSVNRVIECTPDGACEEISIESVGLPRFLRIDFAKKTISRATGDDKRPATAIERQEVVDGKLILQGAEDGYAKMRDGLGWTLAISEATGQVVLTASGEQVAFVVFGASIPF